MVLHNNLSIYYSKKHKMKWFIALAVLVAFYCCVFIFMDLEIHFIFHALTFVYLVLIVISLLRPYLYTDGKVIKSGFNVLVCLETDKLIGVFIIDGDYVFREKKKSLHINLDLVSVEDKNKVIAYLEKRNLLKSDYDLIKDLS